MKVLGLCLGASTVSAVHLEKVADRFEVISQKACLHEGDPKKTILKTLNAFDMKSFDRIAATGRRFRKFVQLASISESEAVEYAFDYVRPKHVFCPAVVSAGGETFMVYMMDQKGKIANVLTGSKCASGTGEFFLQQLRRMNVSLDEAAQWASTQDPYHVSGRCSVFCKSDCTHATNKGIPKQRVTAGLCKMMANKILELLKKSGLENVMITGGTSQNRMMIEYLRQEIPGLIVPRQAPYFEALGAALWASQNKTRTFPGYDHLFRKEVTSFDVLPQLSRYEKYVDFKTIRKDKVRAGDKCVLGLDVGSTTTKAVLVRASDNSMLSSVYLRTDGDPISASRSCYRHILEDVKTHVNPGDIEIYGLGICGSGRQIAGIHAMTQGVINEIIAHATAAIYFDPGVDTIFEIGGQDAKYTYITNSVPSDYAMNEACSAGTGSFLEESAFETLGVPMEEIADIAVAGKNPPNFNDQCAAFITSDIKNAIHEGVEHEDIVSGLVYSICMNYANRVKGNRPVGDKVFMQGGVCYNHAVPLAMAALVGKPIIVPPEPGLMGAFGVALEVKKRIENGFLDIGRFDLQTLAEREVTYGKTFTCKGGKQACDRRCQIAVIQTNGRHFPFGGACNRYYNLRNNIKYDVEVLDQVRVRQQMVFRHKQPQRSDQGLIQVDSSQARFDRQIGINRSFLVNTFFPLYQSFFNSLGLGIVMPQKPSQEGIDHKGAAFCYPAELSHGFFHTLIDSPNPPDYLFLPHFKSIPAQKGSISSQVCPFVQGETFFLQTTFKKQIDQLKNNGVRVFTPLLDLKKGLDAARMPLVKMAKDMGVNGIRAHQAFNRAVDTYHQLMAQMKNTGQQILDELAKDPDQMAVVLFGRPYNAFVQEANMGIPHKFASRGIKIIPFDFLPYESEITKRHMYWGMGQLILKAANLVKNHPQLFGTYITNFSCGPDSFILGYFRDIMGQKPSLTLELDSHTADAGLETRIEAFIDIVNSYRQLLKRKAPVTAKPSFVPAQTVVENGKAKVRTSFGKTLSMQDPRVTLLFPSMGKYSTEALAAVFKGIGFNAIAYPPADEGVLKAGRANTTCKECLPLILTTGTLIKYLNNGRPKNEILVYFMPTASGPCRFGQYSIFMEDYIKKHQIPDVALLSLTSENGYMGIGSGLQKKAWWGLVAADAFEDIRSMILVNAKNPDAAMQIFDTQWQSVLTALQKGSFKFLQKQLREVSRNLKTIPVKIPNPMVPKISLVGEIFVRRDGLSRQYMIRRLAQMGFATVCAPITEWIHYTDYCVDHGLIDYSLTAKEKFEFFIKKKFVNRYERTIKSILSESGWISSHLVDINSIIERGKTYISPDLSGEAILTVGSSLHEVVSNACGVIAIGPFGCMPNRLSESILKESMNTNEKLKTEPQNSRLRVTLNDVDDLPFLAIESDGSPFPQLISSKLEAFCLRAMRLHEKMMASQVN